MKKLYTLLFTALITSASFAQDAGCYESYRKVFENRGTFDITDGVHDDVIISSRSSQGNECFLGSVTVKNGEVVEIAIYFEDNTKEVVVYEFKDKVTWSVDKGISRTRVTRNDEQINVMFTDQIKPKKKQYKKAPLPKFDLN
jgi:hypothetical protein